MADTARLVQAELVRLAQGVSGMALACNDRWVCMLEGEMAEVELLIAAVVNSTRPKAMHLLMSDPQAKLLLFPEHHIGWRFDATLLQMSAFVNDLHRNTRRATLWTMPLPDIATLLEPDS